MCDHRWELASTLSVPTKLPNPPKYPAVCRRCEEVRYVTAEEALALKDGKDDDLD